ncbi:MAG: type II toxin-antitoxin system MqsA family antitoxin [Oscillospiraceae bacterium]|jgi:YgiT-type zinc finger domain-containing protein
MTCFFCKGQTVETTTKFIVDLGNCVVIVKNVPAKVCQQCGETSFSDEVAQQLEKIVDTVKHSIMTEVAIIEYSAA